MSAIKPQKSRCPLFISLGSPNKLKDRTFRAEFKLPNPQSERKPVEHKPSKFYQNPIVLAQHWREALASGSCASPASLARQLRVSRARVTQVLRLLRLTPKVRKTIAALGDPLPASVMTERSLRPIIDLPPHEQLKKIQAMIAKGSRSFVC